MAAGPREDVARAERYSLVAMNMPELVQPMLARVSTPPAEDSGWAFGSSEPTPERGAPHVTSPRRSAKKLL
jgi:hypothetical protein